MKIIFVDIDGPLLPAKMHLFRENRHSGEYAPPKFDEFAIRVFNLWQRYSDAKVVFSTYWANHFTVDELKNIMRVNGLGFMYHQDILTPKKMTSRRHDEIFWWLENHPEVTHWIAVDDDTDCRMLEERVVDAGLAPGRWIRVDYNNGLSYENFYDGCNGLSIDSKVVTDSEFVQTPMGSHHTGGLW